MALRAAVARVDRAVDPVVVKAAVRVAVAAPEVVDPAAGFVSFLASRRIS